MPDEAQLAAGTLVEYSLDVVTPAWVELEGILSIGAMGFMAEPKDRTVLKDTEKKYGAGMKDAPDKTIKGQHYSSNTDQKAFLDACKLAKTVLIRVTYPDKPDSNPASVGTIAESEIATLGFELDDVKGEDWMMFTVNGKQNTIAWTDPVVGV